MSGAKIDQFRSFPGTRYMGSKNKIIDQIWDKLKDYAFTSFFDGFAGSNVVSYYMKCQGKKVITNDFMANSHALSKAIIENSRVKLETDDINFLISNKNASSFISKTFRDLYFEDSDNRFLDRVRFNISLLDNEYKRSIALAALVRACIKKRPRGVFTFTGHRYNDGRKDLVEPIKSHFLHSVELCNHAIFNNGHKCRSFNLNIDETKVVADLVYLDPPYFTPNSDNDYVRRYHFVEGLVKNWEGLEIQTHTKTKKFKSYKSPFAKRKTAHDAFEHLIDLYKDSIIAISYSSNSFPTKKEITMALKKHKSRVECHEIDHLYSFGNQNHRIGNNANRVKEYLFIGS
jgi:adenine-specific DNA methylase